MNINKLSIFLLLIGLALVDAQSQAQADISEQEMTMKTQAPQKTFDDIAQFMQIKKQQKGAWLDFEKQIHTAKFDLKKKHHDEWADWHIKMIKKHKDMQDPATFGQEKLKEMVALYEKQKQEWKDLCDKEYKQGQDMGMQQAKQLQEFKVSAGLAPAEEKEMTEEMKTAPTQMPARKGPRMLGQPEK